MKPKTPISELARAQAVGEQWDGNHHEGICEKEEEGERIDQLEIEIEHAFHGENFSPYGYLTAPDCLKRLF